MAADTQLPSENLVPPTEHRRVIVSAFLGAAVGALLSTRAPWQLTVLAGWDVAAFVLVASAWFTLAKLDPESTANIATVEDPGRNTRRFVILGASVASLIGVASAFVKARSVNDTMSTILTIAGVATVAISWVVVHFTYMLRYAHLYYRERQGGIDFGRSDDDPSVPLLPAYQDFAYLAFTVGMTYQVADTDVSDSLIRRTVLRHALLSFLFGTVIVALTINLTASLIH